MAVDTDLADAVLDEVAAGRVDLGQAGRGVVAGAPADDRIEAPYLQLVMRRLWEAEEEAARTRSARRRSRRSAERRRSFAPIWRARSSR